MNNTTPNERPTENRDEQFSSMDSPSRSMSQTSEVSPANIFPTLTYDTNDDILVVPPEFSSQNNSNPEKTDEFPLRDSNFNSSQKIIGNDDSQMEMADEIQAEDISMQLSHDAIDSSNSNPTSHIENDGLMERPETEDLQEFLGNPTRFRINSGYLQQSTSIEEENILTYCVKSQNVGAIETLLKQGVNPNWHNLKGVWPICLAAQKGGVEIIQMLIDAGAEVNAQNDTTLATAIIQASHFGYVDAVNLLLSNKADPHDANAKGTTALMRAAQEGHIEIAQSLLRANVDVNRRNQEGMNALMLASQRGHSNIVRILIQAKAAMDDQTTQGSTALMLACKRGHEDCAQILVSMGAEICMLDKRERTAKETAARRQHMGVIRWLDTQVQIQQTRLRRHTDRQQLLAFFRKQHLKNKLVLNFAELEVYYLCSAFNNPYLQIRCTSLADSEIQIIRTDEKSFTQEQSAHINQDFEYLRNFVQESPIVRIKSKNMKRTIQNLKLPTMNADDYKNKEKLETINPEAKLSARGASFADFLWPTLLMRCMNLPEGVFELIIDYMPLPREWNWVLTKIKRRCNLSPVQAMKDLCVVIDEIFADLNIFSGSDQSDVLMKLNRNHHLLPYISRKYGIPASLLDKLCVYCDIQSLLKRTDESTVIFKPQMAKNMLEAVIYLYRWVKSRTSGINYLALEVTQAAYQKISARNEDSSSPDTKSPVLDNRGVSFASQEVDILGEVTGNEDFSDMDEDARMMVDQDTENEMINNFSD